MLGLLGPGQGAKCKKGGPWGSVVHRTGTGTWWIPLDIPNGAGVQRQHFLVSQQDIGDLRPSHREGVAKLGGGSRESKAKYAAQWDNPSKGRMTSHMGILTQGYNSQPYGKTLCQARSGFPLFKLLCRDWFRIHDFLSAAGQG